MPKTIIKFNKGSSTLEILIAFAILILCMTAVVMVGFGNQSISVDSQIEAEALSKARTSLETARALAQADFASVVSASTIESSGPLLYAKSLAIADASHCAKQATSTVSWSSQGLPAQKIELGAYLTDIIEISALGGDCPIDQALSNWSTPKENASVSFGKATGIDIFKGTAFISLSDTATSSPDLAIVDITSSTSPTLLGSTDLDSSGFTAIDVATSSNGRLYAYAGSGTSTKQFVVLDVSSSTDPFIVASSTLPGMTSGTSAIIRSVFYYNAKVYVGTQQLDCPACRSDQDNELHIFDVTDPTHPVWKKSVRVNRNLNALEVRGGFLYAATGAGGTTPYTPLNIFDIDPLSANYGKIVGSFKGADSNQGTALYLLGERLYLGMAHATFHQPELYAVDISSTTVPALIASTTLSLGSSAKVTGIIAAGNYAYIATSDSKNGFQVRDISSATLPLVSTVKFASAFAGLDVEQSAFFLAGAAPKTLDTIGPSL